MADGVIAEQGTPAALFGNQQRPRTVQFLSKIAEAQVSGARRADVSTLGVSQGGSATRSRDLVLRVVSRFQSGAARRRSTISR